MLLCIVLMAILIAVILREGFGFVGGFALLSPSWFVALAAAVIVAINMIVEMIQTFRSGKVGVDILALTAIFVTLFIDDKFGNVTIEGYWASLMIMVMITGGQALEDYASNKARANLTFLLNHNPTTAHVVKDRIEKDVDVNSVKPGDILSIRTGESIPVDGRVLKGQSYLDESSISGESALVEATVGTVVLSGAVNGDSPLTIVALKTAKTSQFQTIVELVKEAESKPSKFVRVADRYAVPFTLVSYLIAGLGWLIYWALNEDASVGEGFRRAAEVLVVASPCPLILAAPIALVSGMSRSSKNGIIVKNSDALERLAAVKTIAFDKTGTITKGVLVVDGVFPTDGITSDGLAILTASAEQNSSHIVARSLVDYVGKKALLPVEGVKEIPGNGLLANVQGHQVKLGKRAFVLPDKEGKINETSTFVSIDGRYAGYITFKDIVRPESRKTLEKLTSLGIKKTILLTGDNERIAQEVAKEVGITDIKANCLPQDKIDAITSLGKEDKPIAMVGDGINDAPVLAAADVGLAMGARGSAAAAQSADMVILVDDFAKVAKSVAISKETLRIARQSVLIGIFLSLLLEVIAATGIIPALIGACLQEGVDLVSIFSALRALRDNKK